MNVAYTRDVQGRVISRAFTNGTATTNYYGFTAGGDTPDFLTDTSGNVTEKYLSLPGNVMVTVRPNQTGAASYAKAGDRKMPSLWPLGLLWRLWERERRHIKFRRMQVLPGTLLLT
jgi:hypothetical protein